MEQYKTDELKVIHLKITPEVIKNFYFLDKRQDFPKYWEDVAWVKNQLLNYIRGGQKPIRYDMCVFNYMLGDKPFHITDGGHRTNALRQLFAEGAVESLDAILLPGTTAHGWDNQVARSDEVIRLVEAEGLPREIIKQRHFKDSKGKYQTIIRPW